MGGAEKAQIVGLGAAAERIRDDVIYLQQMTGAVAAPTGPVHIAAAAPVTLPHLPPDRRRNGAAAYPRLRRRRPAVARRTVRGGPPPTFGAEVAPATSAVQEEAAAGRRAGVASREPAAPAGCAVRGTAATFGVAGSFGAEVAAAISALRRLLRRPRGGRDGSWRSSASCTNRPEQLPRRHLRVDVGQQPL